MAAYLHKIDLKNLVLYITFKIQKYEKSENPILFDLCTIYLTNTLIQYLSGARHYLSVFYNNNHEVAINIAPIFANAKPKLNNLRKGTDHGKVRTWSQSTRS